MVLVAKIFEIANLQVVTNNFGFLCASVCGIWLYLSLVTNRIRTAITHAFFQYGFPSIELLCGNHEVLPCGSHKLVNTGSVLSCYRSKYFMRILL